MGPNRPAGQPRTSVHISLRVEPPFLIVRLRGELDLSNAGDLRAAGHLHQQDPTTVLLDLGELTFCDCAGLRALLRFREAHVARGRDFGAVHIHPRVRHLIELCGASDAFPTASPAALRDNP